MTLNYASLTKESGIATINIVWIGENHWHYRRRIFLSCNRSSFHWTSEDRTIQKSECESHTDYEKLMDLMVVMWTVQLHLDSLQHINQLLQVHHCLHRQFLDIWCTMGCMQYIFYTRSLARKIASPNTCVCNMPYSCTERLACRFLTSCFIATITLLFAITSWSHSC